MEHLDAQNTLGLLEAAPLQIWNHLLDCARCRNRLRDLVDLESVETLGPGFSAPGEQPPSRPISDRERKVAFAERVLVRAAELWASRDQKRGQDAERAHLLYDRLLSLPVEERLELVEKDDSLRSPGLAKLLIAAGDDATDPNLSYHFGHLALTVLDGAVEPTQTLQILAFCLVAESQRRKGNVEVADDILKSTAAELQAELPSSPARVRFCRTLAAVRADQARIDEALALLQRACSLAEEHADYLELAQCRLEQGLILLEESDQEAALTALREALPLLDPTTHPRLILGALHGMALTCADLGRPESLKEALSKLDQLRPFLPDRLDGLRLRWIRAQVEYRLGQVKPAIARLQRVFAALLDGGPSVEAAKAALEIARMHFEGDSKLKPAVFQDLIAALRPLALQGHLPAQLWSVASFALFFAQLDRGHHLEVLDSASRYLQAAQFNPFLPFHPLAEPDLLLNWRDLPKEDRRSTAKAAGIELSGDEPTSPRQRTLLSWTHEALTGVRLRFSEDDSLSFDAPTLPS
jgi:tetratricopeptide (TPR) repeat protein